MPTVHGTVLVVDDDDAVRNSLKFALELHGLSVRPYADGDHLLADGNLPDEACLVVDYRMPVWDGIDLLDCLHERDIHLPAILITAGTAPEIRERAIRSGYRQVLEKPLEDCSLLDGIRSALSEATGGLAGSRA